MFFTQRLTGGVPEAVDATFFGPEMGEAPETSELRKLKRSGEGERWLLLRREGRTVIFKVQDTSSIKASGLYVTVEPCTMRGDSDLLSSLQGYDKVHLCRHESCNEEGPHFKQYAVAKTFNPEGFQLAAASSEAKRASYQMWGWFRSNAGRAVQKARDLASESETEETRCLAGKIRWEDEHGHQRLCSEVCTASGSVGSPVLDEDMPVGVGQCTLCPKHASKYLQGRFQLKCVVAGCTKLGLSDSTTGLRLCPLHAEAHRPPSSRRFSRSRSRAKDRGETEVEDEENGGAGLRRRGRHGPGHDREDGHAAEQLVADMRSVGEQPEPRVRRRALEESSPGRTPRSAVQKNLARLGMINSPDRREMLSVLEEFLAQLVEAKEMGIEEEDLRSQMAASAGTTLKEFTQALYDQAAEEQRKGTKGLTKFLAKWRKQLAAEPAPSSGVSWSGGDPSEERSVFTPESQRTTGSATASLARLPPPGIYGVEDRKAGTGGPPADPAMVDLAKASQNQTTELASLVKSQNDTTATAAAGTMRSLGKMSEELVFLLRACGQYTVEVGANEHGAGLAQALLNAQAGASTKLRNAGFRQKVTPRLAVGLAGPFWGTQEKHALSAADFVPCSDAELDQHAVECRTGKPVNEQRPPAPTRYEDWANRVKRQTDIWALVYGKEWRAVKEHAAQTLGEWHLGAPHRWPLQIVCDVWEELHWRFIEELKTELRKIKGISGRETMKLSDLKFYALMPDEHGNPPLQLPRTFDLHHPEGWFTTEVMPRIERRQERMLWRLTWEGAAKPRGAGQSAGGNDNKADDKLTLKSLLGPKLTTEEVNRAKDRAPVGKDGKLLCWGFLSHLGCNQTNCQRAHEHLRGTFESLDPAVQMQLIRRGGLKRMKPENKDTAVEKIKDLRHHVAQDKNAKVQDGQARRRAGQEVRIEEIPTDGEPAGAKRAEGVTWQAPIEMREVDYTEQEKEFASLVHGPSEDTFKHVAREGKKHDGRGGQSAPSQVQDLLKKAQSLSQGPVLSKLQAASDDLYAWASTRVANDPSITLEALLEDMVQFGLGELAAEAAKILEEHGEEKAGSSRRCVVQDTLGSGDGPGRAMVEIDGKAWTSYDYR